MDDGFRFGTFIGGLVAVVVVVLGLSWAVQGNNFFLYKFFAPREEAVRREVFEQSKAYNEGMAQDLRHMQLEWIKAKPEQKAALASIILHQFAGYDTSKLPSDLQLFLNEVKQSQGVQ
ncbi:MAG TPA: hypothetical protein VM577_14405 [Anaerovoracaceae bacterium]|nr:hypothetical protein [Anaerovoracaceae bacterium]